MATHLARINRLLTGVLASVLRSEPRRVMIFAPPRHGKSELVSRYLPACFLGVAPTKRVILTSYEATFAANWGRKVRDLLVEWGPVLYGIEISDQAGSQSDWEIAGTEGGMKTAGALGPIMGRGADLFVIDDPIKNYEEAVSDAHQEKLWQWFQSTASSRLQPGGSIVLTMQRWRDNDLAGRILKEQPGRWEVLSLPAIAEDDEFDEAGAIVRRTGEALWPEMWPVERLEHEVKSVRDRFWWEAQYQQEAGNFSTAAWPAEYFTGDDLWFRDWPSPLRCKVLALDPSKGVKGERPSSGRLPDYSAYVWMGIGPDDRLYVEADLDRYRPAEKIVEDGVRHWRRFQPEVFVLEGNSWQDLLRNLFDAEFKAKGSVKVPIELCYHTIRKEVRILSLGAYLEKREICFRTNSEGTMRLFEQLRNFRPGGGGNDDGPDALEMGISALARMTLPGDGLGNRLRGVAVK